MTYINLRRKLKFILKSSKTVLSLAPPKLLENLGGAEMTGPILEGFSKPVQLVARSDDVRHIVNMAAICALDAIRQDSYWDKINEN